MGLSSHQNIAIGVVCNLSAWNHELTSVARLRFKNANSEKKRKLLEFMLSIPSWVDGKLEVELFEAFDLMLEFSNRPPKNENEIAENGLVNIKSVDWWR